MASRRAKPPETTSTSAPSRAKRASSVEPTKASGEPTKASVEPTKASVEPTKASRALAPGELPTKARVFEAMREALHKALAVMAQSAEEARQGAVHEENRSEGDKDMRATEQSYVARGQAMRVEQLAEEVARFEQLVPRELGPGAKVALGALVRVRVDDEPRVVFVAAQGGGTQLVVDGVEIVVLTASSPAGRLLMGREEGDEFELVAAGKTRVWEVEKVR